MSESPLVGSADAFVATPRLGGLRAVRRTAAPCWWRCRPRTGTSPSTARPGGGSTSDGTGAGPALDPLGRGRVGGGLHRRRQSAVQLEAPGATGSAGREGGAAPTDRRCSGACRPAVARRTRLARRVGGWSGIAAARAARPVAARRRGSGRGADEAEHARISARPRRAQGVGDPARGLSGAVLGPRPRARPTSGCSSVDLAATRDEQGDLAPAADAFARRHPGPRLHRPGRSAA